MRSVWRRIGVVLAVVMILAVSLVPAASAAPAASSVTYWVRPGDNLYSIAARFGVSAASIAAANGLRNWNHVYVGQALVIPYGAAPAPCGGCGSGSLYYTVRPGDTLMRIAARYGVNYWSLAQMNGIANPSCIYVGQMLQIRRGYTPQPQPMPCGYQGCYPQPQPQPQPQPWPQPWPQPQPLTGPWTGDYYNTPDLSGSVVLERQDQAIDFNWGYGSPAYNQVNTTSWSARWTQTLYLNGGTWRAQVAVDDGARVYVDGVLVISAWQVQSVRTYTQDFQVGSGNHTITVEYFQDAGTSEVHFSLWQVR